MQFNRNIIHGILSLLLAFGPVSHAMAGNATELAEKLNDQWNTAFNSGDAAGVAALYAENAALSPGNGKTLHGRDSIRELFQSFMDNGVHDHSIEVIEAHKAGDMLYEVAHWQAHGTDAEGNTTSFGGILVNIFRRTGEDTWRSHTHVWNTGD